MSNLFKKFVPYLVAGVIALGGCKRNENQEKVGRIQSLDKIVLEESLTPAPWNFHPIISKEIVQEMKGPKECVLTEDIKKDLDQRYEGMIYVLGKVPQVGERMSQFFSTTRNILINYPRSVTEQLEKWGAIKDTCPALETWVGSPEKWNVSSLSLRVYRCKESIPTERCDDGRDNDCDGEIDYADSDCKTQPREKTKAFRKPTGPKCKYQIFMSKSPERIGGYLGISASQISFETDKFRAGQGVSIKISTTNGYGLFEKILPILEKKLGRGSGRVIKTWGSGGRPMSNGCYVNLQRYKSLVRIQVFSD